MLLDHPDADHTDAGDADDRDADGGGDRLHCLLLSHQHCLGKTRALKHYFVMKTYIDISITLIIWTTHDTAGIRCIIIYLFSLCWALHWPYPIQLLATYTPSLFGQFSFHILLISTSCCLAIVPLCWQLFHLIIQASLLSHILEPTDILLNERKGARDWNMLVLCIKYSF